MTDAAPHPPTATSPPPPPSPKRRRLFWPVIALVAALVLIAAVFLLQARFEARTDDAYVEADVVAVAPRVAGYVVELDVDDNARFKAGDELLRIDDRDYRNAVASAQADLSSARAARDEAVAALARQSAVVASARASLSGDRAQVTFARQQVERYGPLSKGGFGSIEHLQQFEADRATRQASLDKDTAELSAAQGQVGVLKADVGQAQAEVARRQALLDQARLNLSYTRITADFDGTVANRIVRAGAYVQPGQTLLSEVPMRPYVVANYKETQLARMRIGQRVWIRVDGFPGERLRAHVDSLQRGTGSRFALLPPENATGNFVKVVQRVPVKIVFDEPVDRLARLAPGMSVETFVDFAHGDAGDR